MSNFVSPADHWMHDHLDETGEREESKKRFYARMDDGSVIKHIPDGPVYDVQIERGDQYERDSLRDFAQHLTAYYQQQKIVPVEVTPFQ